MNVRRGLFRVWVVGSLLWTSLNVWLTYDDWVPGLSARGVAFQFLTAMVFTLVPIAIAFGIGVAAIWCGAGFKSN